MKEFHMILPLALILGFMVGCQDKGAMAELEAFRAQAAVEEQNKEVVKLYIDIINKREFDSLDKVLSPDYTIFTPSRLFFPNPKSRSASSIRSATPCDMSPGKSEKRWPRI